MPRPTGARVLVVDDEPAIRRAFYKVATRGRPPVFSQET